MTAAVQCQEAPARWHPSPRLTSATGRAAPAAAVAPALVSTALAGLLDGPVTTARVVAAGRHAVYFRVQGAPSGAVAVLGLLSPEAVRLPNAAVVSPAVLATVPLAEGDAVDVGGGGFRLRAGTTGGRAGAVTVVEPARWWDPRPRLGAITPAVLAARVSDASTMLPPWPGAVAPWAAQLATASAALERATTGPDRAHLATAARDLLGLGPGSTPSGDDFLAGVLAAARLFGEALAARGAVSCADALARLLRPMLGRTAPLSATLLACAAQGHVCVPVATLCRALAGQGSSDTALGRLVAVGHTSGADLAAGLLCGARVALAHARGSAGGLG